MTLDRAERTGLIGQFVDWAWVVEHREMTMVLPSGSRSTLADTKLRAFDARFSDTASTTA